VPKKEKGMNQMPNKMKKKPHSPEFKFKVAIDAIRGDKTTAELSQEYSVVSSQIFKWKKALLGKVLKFLKMALLLNPPKVPKLKSFMPKSGG